MSEDLSNYYTKLPEYLCAFCETPAYSKEEMEEHLRREHKKEIEEEG